MDMTNTNPTARSYYLKTVGDVLALIGRYQVVTTIRPNPLQARAIEIAFAK